MLNPKDLAPDYRDQSLNVQCNGLHTHCNTIYSNQYTVANMTEKCFLSGAPFEGLMTIKGCKKAAEGL